MRVLLWAAALAVVAVFVFRFAPSTTPTAEPETIVEVLRETTPALAPNRLPPAPANVGVPEGKVIEPTSTRPAPDTVSKPAEYALQQKVIAASQHPVESDVLEGQLRRTMREKPEDPLAYVALGDLLVRRQRWEQSVPILEKAAELSGDDPGVVAFRLASAYYATQRPDKAEELFARRLERLERQAGTAAGARVDDARIDYAWSLAQNGKPREADAVVRPLAERRPNDSQLQKLAREIRAKAEASERTE